MMIEALSLGFFQRALMAGVLLSLLCGVLSVFVILRRMAFVGVGISHSAFGGVALGFLLGLDPLLSGIGFAVAVALLIEWAQERGRLEEDAAIGIFFAVAMALGVVFLSLSRTYNVDVFGFLFGNILAVGPAQLGQIAVISLVVLATVAFFYKELVFLSFDEEMAWVSGVPVKALRYLFLVLLALVIIMAIYLVGIILVSALLVIPGAVARKPHPEHRRHALDVGDRGGGGHPGGHVSFPGPGLALRRHRGPGPGTGLLRLPVLAPMAMAAGR